MILRGVTGGGASARNPGNDTSSNLINQSQCIHLEDQLHAENYGEGIDKTIDANSRVVIDGRIASSRNSDLSTVKPLLS
jgi:hypothetical protein